MAAIPARSPQRAALAVLIFGLVVMAAAIVWWLTYYSQYEGLSLLDVKLGCLSGDASECTSIQSFVGPSPIPVYSPMLLWAGTVVALIGLYLSRRNKA